MFKGNCYKKIIKELCKARRITLKEVASRIDVQYTYFSKSLSNPKIHLGEDVLFEIGQVLDLSSEECGYLALLRARDATSSSKRRQYLEDEIHKIRQRHRIRDAEDLEGIAAEYFRDPMCVVVHVNLSIERYRQNLNLLASDLNISREYLDAIISKLVKCRLVDRAQGYRTTSEKIHLRPDHPLFELHQRNLTRLAMSMRRFSRKAQQQSFKVVFSSNPRTAELVNERIQGMIDELQELQVSSQETESYYLGLDFFPLTKGAEDLAYKTPQEPRGS